MRTSPAGRIRDFLFTAFAATASASVVLQNTVWGAVAAGLVDRRGKEALLIPPGRWTPLTKATVFLFATFLLGAAFGVDPRESFRTVHKYSVLLLLPLTALLIQDEARSRRLLAVFVAGTSVCAAWGITKHLSGAEERITSFSGHYIVFGGLLMTALVLLLYFLDRNPRSLQAWAAAALLFPALLLTQTRGAWLGLAAGLVVFGAAVNRRLLAAGASLLLGTYFLLPAHLKERVRSIGEVKPYTSSGERWFMWQAGVRIARDHPLFGVGQGNVSNLYDRYASPLAQERHVPHLHNNFMQLLVQNGIVGLAAYLLWISAYVRSFSRSLPARDGPGRRLQWTFFAFFAAHLVWGLTEYTFSHQFLHVQMFLLGMQAGLWRSRRS